jgi:hypothetical protein
MGVAKVPVCNSLLASSSPIEWTNVILYGEYKLNRDLVDVLPALKDGASRRFLVK